MNYQKLITKNNTLKDADSPIWNVPKPILEDRQKVFELGMQTDIKAFEEFIEKEVTHQHPRINQKLTFNGSAKHKLEIAFNLGYDFAEDNYDLLRDLSKAQEHLESRQEYFNSCNPKSRTGLDAYEELDGAKAEVEKLLTKLDEVIENA